MKTEYSLDDMFILPQLFEGESRSGVELRPRDIVVGRNPIVAANMNAVCGRRMAETLARNGSLGVLPQDMSIETLERILPQIRHANPRWDTPLTVEPEDTLRTVRGLLYKRSHGMVVVVDKNEKVIGIVTDSDLEGRDQYDPVSSVMSSEGMVLVDKDMTDSHAYRLLHSKRVKAAPVVGRNNQLVGITTRSALVRSQFDVFEIENAVTNGLPVAGAVGIGEGAVERASQLAALGACMIVVDTAHGHQKKMGETLRKIRKKVSWLPIVAGNVCTREGVRFLVENGAHIVKVNVGPGAMCTTRMQTGVGRPTFTAVQECADEARTLNRHVWADGGVRHPRDVALYLAAGASRVMVGTMFAGTYESPGEVQVDEQGMYKVNYGMASAKAVDGRTGRLDPFIQAQKQIFREGISTSKVRLKPGMESVTDLLTNLLTGVMSSFTYSGAWDIESFQERVKVGVQTSGGYNEGKPRWNS